MIHTTTRLAAAAALTLAGALVAGTAQARDADVQWSITIGGPVYPQPAPVYGVPAPVYGVPAPVYGHPVPVYGQPVPVYRQPVPVYRQPVPVVVLPAPVWVPGGAGHHHQRRVDYRPPTRWDIDGDGIPNRADRVYNPHWDSDGNGIADHRDRGYRDVPSESHRRDGYASYGGWSGRGR